MSQPAMSRAINRISYLISTHLLARYIKFPTSEMEIRIAKESFRNENLHFPNAIGAIDCTHVAIVSPKTNDPIQPAVAYINRKGFYSINVQAVFDANLMIRNVNAQYPGSAHDVAIWNVSKIQYHMRRKYGEGRRNCYLLGDSGFPIQPWLLTPILNPQPNNPEERYNIVHRIICSCAVLHNICRQHNLPDVGNDDDHNQNIEKSVGIDMNLMNVMDNDDLAEGRFVRSQVIQEIFQ